MKFPEHIRRHRHFQIGLTVGVVACFGIQLFMQGIENVIINITQTIVTIIWLWEQ